MSSEGETLMRQFKTALKSFYEPVSATLRSWFDNLRSVGVSVEETEEEEPHLSGHW